MLHNIFNVFFRKILDRGHRHPLFLGLTLGVVIALLAAALLPLFF